MSNTANLVKPNKASALASVRALIAGTQKHAPAGSLTVGNASYAAESLIQLLQSLADAMKSHDDAQAKAKDVLAALRDVTAKVGPVVRAYRRYVVAMYGTAVETLADYGLKPPSESATDKRAEGNGGCEASCNPQSAGDHEQEAEGFDTRSGHGAGGQIRHAARATEAGDLTLGKGAPAALGAPHRGTDERERLTTGRRPDVRTVAPAAREAVDRASSGRVFSWV